MVVAVVVHSSRLEYFGQVLNMESIDFLYAVSRVTDNDF
jgi:hypothetical protein